MRWLGFTAVPVLLALGIAACGESLSPESLAGTYDVTTLELINPDNPSQTFDELEGIPCNYTITITAAGGITVTCDGETSTGTIVIDGDGVTLTLDGEPGTGTISRDGDTVTIYLNDVETNDWDAAPDTPDTAADIRLVMTKTS